MQRARIKISSTDIDKLNEILNSIIDIAKRSKVKIFGPIPFPTQKLKVTTRKAPDGEGKASFDNFEMRIHKRVIDLGVDEKALRLVMRVHIPERVNLSIEILE